ncbi:hypothetical protein [Streptomyces sp. NPDC005507]|uniref:hypothetical protein n=1 Tax=Streptomyces sp. NPDC005507 TaxID=3154885 RepID=UPI0033AABC58
MATGKIPLADLDPFTTDQHALARTMRVGQEASDALRYQYQTWVRRFNETRSAHQTAREEVVALPGTLLNHRHGPQARSQAATKLRTAIAGEATQRRNLAQQSGEARKATAALAPAPRPPTSSQPSPPANVPDNV